MPGAFSEGSSVVFTTAHDHYALRAFGANAVHSERDETRKVKQIGFVTGGSKLWPGRRDSHQLDRCKAELQMHGKGCDKQYRDHRYGD